MAGVSMKGAIPTMDGRIHQWHATYAFDGLESYTYIEIYGIVLRDGLHSSNATKNYLRKWDLETAVCTCSLLLWYDT